VYGILLGLSTITHQPSVDDFDAYARYTTTDVFLASHLGASIFGAALAILGVTALTAFLIRSTAARTSVAGLVLTTVSNVFMAAAFGSAAFVQPGIGRAHLAGMDGMPALNADTAYGPALFATALGATFLLMVAAVVTGVAIARSNRRLRWLGVGYAVVIPAFALSGQLVQSVQAATGFALAAVTAVLAWRLPRVGEDAARSAGRPSLAAPAQV
jgi:hypothetical protein